MCKFEEITNFWMRKEFDIYKNIFEVSYEELVKHENKVGNEIYNFIGIHSEYQGTGREKFFSRTASRFQIDKKINQKSVNKSFLKMIRPNFFKISKITGILA